MSTSPSPSHEQHTTSVAIITSDEQALSVARSLARRFAEGAALRDRERRLPQEEVEEFSATGLWGITIPKAYGGAGVSQVTIANVFRIIAAADSSLAQIPQNHFEIVDLIRQTGTEEQKRTLFGLVLKGARLGNAFSEFKGRNVEDFQTRIVRQGSNYVVNGEKFYSTGALFAHMVPIVALDETGKVLVAITDRNTPGLEVVDDWSAFGQRTTASGTVRITDVVVPSERVLPAYQAYDVYSAAGPQSQIAHAAIDLGLAEAAIAKTIELVRNHARPWIDSGKDKASEDPHTIAQIGELSIKVHAAHALLDRAGHTLDKAIAKPGLDEIARAKIAVAEAKVLTSEVAILATNKLFELAGTRSVLAAHSLDRLWRDARTHTLHDPVRWKLDAVGKFYLNGVNPPMHSWI